MPDHKTAIITGASRGIGAGLVQSFLKQGYNVVATSRNVSRQLAACLPWFDRWRFGKPELPPRSSKQQSQLWKDRCLVCNAGIFSRSFHGIFYGSLTPWSHEPAGIPLHHFSLL